MVAGIRTHWGGLIQFGAPDGVVVNVAKKAVRTARRRCLRLPIPHAYRETKPASCAASASSRRASTFPIRATPSRSLKKRPRAMSNTTPGSITRRLSTAAGAPSCRRSASASISPSRMHGAAVRPALASSPLVRLARCRAMRSEAFSTNVWQGWQSMRRDWAATHERGVRGSQDEDPGAHESSGK